MKNLALIAIAIFIVLNTAHAQCTVVSNVSGTIHDSAAQVFIDYTVEIAGGAEFYGSPAFSACGLDYPDVYTAWTGNSVEAGTIVYTFSEPLLSVQVFLAGVGLNGSITQESFTFTTEGQDPILAVDAGSCAEWIIDGNTVTSPDVIDGLNSIAIVSSDTPFTTLTILSSDQNNLNGGSFIGLCNSSAIPGSSVGIWDNIWSDQLTVYPNPTADFTIIDLGQLHEHVQIVTTDMMGKQLYAGRFNQVQLIQLEMPYPAGNYILRVTDGESSTHMKVVVH